MNVCDLILTAILSETVKCVYLHPVTFKLIWGEISDDILKAIQEHLINGESKMIYEISDHLDWTTFIMPQFHLTAKTKQTGNTSPYGGGCGNLCIPRYDFEWTKECKAGITLKDLTEAVYRLKGSNPIMDINEILLLDIPCIY